MNTPSFSRSATTERVPLPSLPPTTTTALGFLSTSRRARPPSAAIRAPKFSVLPVATCAPAGASAGTAAVAAVASAGATAALISAGLPVSGEASTGVSAL